ncbi:MAG: tetratricopeptide repeat protein [Proteobacteria bacterium]|nr:tetratricopeptide repeat protein [Pseudomonadota bacterium]
MNALKRDNKSIETHLTSNLGQIYFWILWVLVASLAGGCSIFEKMSHGSPDNLREEVADQVPELTPGEVVIPFEVGQEYVDMAMQATSGWTSQLDRAQKLVKALFDPKQFGIEYADVITTTASETLKNRKGNCLSIASTYVGLAREIGMIAYYLDASHRVQEVFRNEEFIVNSGHITAVVETEQGKMALDFGDQLSYFLTFRKISDMEAVAHFYNNRGYELIHQAQSKNEPIDWTEVAKSFSTAARVMPDFESAWNNLGIAYARLGRHREAEACYKKAIAENPDFATPYSNLGILYLANGDVDAAIESFEIAVKSKPDDPYVHFRLGAALNRKGQIKSASLEIERAVAIKSDYKEAKTLLARLYRQQGRKSEAERFDRESSMHHSELRASAGKKLYYPGSFVE